MLLSSPTLLDWWENSLSYNIHAEIHYNRLKRLDHETRLSKVKPERRLLVVTSICWRSSGHKYLFTVLHSHCTCMFQSNISLSVGSDSVCWIDLLLCIYILEFSWRVPVGSINTKMSVIYRHFVRVFFVLTVFRVLETTLFRLFFSHVWFSVSSRFLRRFFSRNCLTLSLPRLELWTKCLTTHKETTKSRRFEFQVDSTTRVAFVKNTSGLFERSIISCIVSCNRFLFLKDQRRLCFIYVIIVVCW